MPRYFSRPATLAVVLLTVGSVAACTGSPPSPAPTTTSPGRPQSRTTMPGAATTVVPGAGPVDIALGASRALFASAPAVVLVGVDDQASLPAAVTTAVDHGVPLLVTPPADPVAAGPTPSPGGTGSAVSAAVRAELARLAPRSVVTVGASAAAWARTDPAATTAVAVSPSSVDQAVLPDVLPPPPLGQLLVLALADPASAAAVATARAAGARILTMTGPDPRTSSAAIKALAAAPPAAVLALGSKFGAIDVLRSRIDTAATGVELPGGGQVVFPGRRMVALYGHPGNTILGALGEQSLDATVTRARAVAAAYSALVNEPVVPTFEIIATVASASAGSDGNYSNEVPVSVLKPWVDAARAAGVYVVLDLQPGRSDFLSQAKLYAALLTQPNVGLALDPEWRLKPNQVHMQQIGTVDSAEINATSAWLAELTRANHLPQKVFMVHQFRLDMISNRSALATSYDELRVVIHVDGFGTPGEKFSTWNTLHQNAPANVLWGWKNFYDEDKPTFTPQQTVANQPSPVFVSYQ